MNINYKDGETEVTAETKPDRALKLARYGLGYAALYVLMVSVVAKSCGILGVVAIALATFFSLMATFFILMIWLGLRD